MKNTNKLKTLKIFERNDIFIYAVLLAAIVLLFVFTVILPQKKQAEGFSVYCDGNLAFTLDYSAPENYKITVGYESAFSVSLTEDTVTYYFSADKTQYNVISFDSEKKTAKVTKSTCSVSPDCVYSPEIGSGGAIICAPHKLKITPIRGGFEPPVTG